MRTYREGDVSFSSFLDPNTSCNIKYVTRPSIWMCYGPIYDVSYVWKYQPSYCGPLLLFQAAWKFQYGFQQNIDHVFVRALAMPSCFVSWIPIGHCFQRNHPLNLRPNLPWSVSYYGICASQHSLSTLVKCQIFGRFIVNVQKAIVFAQNIV